MLLAAAAAADGDAGFLQLMQALPLLMIMMWWLEMMGLFGMEREMMPVAKERNVDHSGPVREGLALQPLALEGFRVALGSPLLSAHLWGAGTFIGGLHLSVHPRWEGWVSGGVLAGIRAVSRRCLAQFPMHWSAGWANLLTSLHSNPQSGVPIPRPFQAGRLRRDLCAADSFVAAIHTGSNSSTSKILGEANTEVVIPELV